MASAFDTVVDLLTRIEFVVGVLFGGIALGGFIVVGREKPIPGWGLSLVAASLAAISFTRGPRWSLALGVAAMAAGGYLLPRRAGDDPGTPTGALQIVAWSLIVAGALLIGSDGTVAADWAPLASSAVAVGFGFLLGDWTTREERPVLGLVILISIFGMWTTLPETDYARALVGAGAPLALATLPRIGARITISGAFALGGLVAWAGTTGGVTRPASTIGAWACMGMAVLLPFLSLVVRHRLRVPAASLLTLHVILVAISARVIGLWESTALAAVAVAPLLAAAGLLVVLLAGDSRSEPV